MSMTQDDIREYASGINPAEFPYFCAITGELAPSLFYVIRTTIADMFCHRFPYHIKHHWVKVAHVR